MCNNGLGVPSLTVLLSTADLPFAPANAALQVQFTIDANFKLDDLLRLELHKFEDEVGEIVDRAQKEEKMEQGLAKLKVRSGAQGSAESAAYSVNLWLTMPKGRQ